MMLEARTEIMMQVIEVANQTDSLSSLLDALKHLDNFFGRERAVVKLGPCFPASGSLWDWAAFKKKDDGALSDCFYNGGLLYRDGEWSLHS